MNPRSYALTIMAVLLLCRSSRALTVEPATATINSHLASLDRETQDHVRYLSLSSVPDAEVGAWHRALLFSVASASRAVSLERQLPRRLDGTRVYWIDLRELRWDVRDWNKVLAKYPYAVDEPGNRLRVIRGDWLVHELADTRDSQALYLLLYGEKNIPKTDSDFLKFWGVNEKQQQNGVTIGWTETQSQVNKQGTRFVERFITASADPQRGLSFGRSLWRTKDSFFLEEGTDPLESLDGGFIHQGRELIAQFPKLGRSNGKMVYGAAQAYLLAAGNADAENKPAKNEGAVVQEAPVRLVEDYNKTLGQAAIVNHSSCVVCHEAGLKMPTENGLEHLLRVGVELRVYDRNRREQVEAFHLTDAGKQLARDNEDYAEFVQSCNGMKTDANAKNYKRVLDLHLAPLSMDDAARELRCTPDDLRLALGYASANNVNIGNRLAGLAHGRPMPRGQWEGDFRKAQVMVQLWKGGTPHLIAEQIGAVRRPTLAAAPQVEPPKELNATAGLVVYCRPDAVIAIDNKPTKATGPRREFTMKVAADWHKTMTVRAVVIHDGRRWVSEKQVECRAGETPEIVMDLQGARLESQT